MKRYFFEKNRKHLVVMFAMLGSVMTCFTACKEEHNGAGGSGGVDVNTLSNTYDNNLSNLEVTFENQINVLEKGSFPTESSSDTIKIVYKGSSATVEGNVEGVTVGNVSGAIEVSSTAKKVVVYSLSGVTTIGSFTIESAEEASVVVLNGLTMNNANGSAINNQSKKGLNIYIAPSTENTISDGATSGVKGAVYSVGAIEVAGNGILNVTGNYKNAINSSKATVTIKEGILLNLTANKGNGVKGEKGIEIEGGTMNITAVGEGGKGFSSDEGMTVNGGRIAVKTSGNAYYDSEEDDVQTPTGVKTEENFVMNGGKVYLQSSGSGGKGINSDEDVVINGGTLNIITTGTKYVYDESEDLDSSPKGIKADGNLTINGGNIAIKAIGEKDGSKGMDSKSDLVINGGTIEIYSKDDAMSASSITIKDGKIYARSTNNDAIESNKTLKIEGGLVVAVGSAAPKGSLVCDKNDIEISGGIVLGFGGSNPVPSLENSVLSIIYGSSLKTVYALTSVNGDHILTYETPNDYTGQYSILMSTPRLNMGGKYEISSGVTACGGTTFHGLSVDGSYLGGTSLSIVTLTSAVTSLGIISTRSGSEETEKP